MKSLKDINISSKIPSLLENTQYFNVARDVAILYREKYLGDAEVIIEKLEIECDAHNEHGIQMRRFWSLVRKELQSDSN